VTITGIDEISKNILDSFNKGIKVKDIPSMFPRFFGPGETAKQVQ
jgi:hypothetical protein